MVSSERKQMKSEAIDRILAATGNTEQIYATIDNIMDLQTRQFDDADFDTVSELLKTVFRENNVAQKLLEYSRELWDKYFSEEDLLAIANFYESPAGRSVNRTMPAMILDLTERSAQLSEEAIKVVLDRLDSEESNG